MIIALSGDDPALRGDTAADSGSASFTLTATGYDAARSVGALTNFLTLDADGYHFSVLDRNISVFEDHYALVEDENVPFNGSSNATVTYHFDGDVAERLSSSSAEDTEAGKWDKSTIVMIEGNPVKAYVDEEPDDVANDSTYTIVDSSNNSLVVHPGSDYDGQSQIDSITVDANRGWRAVSPGLAPGVASVCVRPIPYAARRARARRNSLWCTAL